MHFFTDILHFQNRSEYEPLLGDTPRQPPPVTPSLDKDDNYSSVLDGPPTSARRNKPSM